MSLYRTKSLAKSMFFKDKKLPFIETRFALNSTKHYAQHFHKTLSIGAVEDGEVSYRHKFSNYLLRQNALAIINPYEVHSCNPLEKQPRTYHMTYIDTNYCKQVQESIFGHLHSYMPILKINIDDKGLYRQYLKLNYALIDLKYLYIEKEELLYEFLVNLFTKYCPPSTLNHPLKIEPKSLIEKSKKFMEKNMAENLSIKDISGHVGLSPFHFIRTFKEITCMSPHAYLLNLKIIEAKKLLENGLNISEVAQNLGFFDQSHLHRVFKSHIATTPFKYKKDIYTSKE